MSVQEKAEMRLKSDGWKCKETKYPASGRIIVGWSHPSEVFKKPASFESAWDFYLKYNLYSDWHYDNQGWN